MLDYFNSKTGGILSTDKEQGQILGKGSFQKSDEFRALFRVNNDYTFIFKIQIDCKDNKYRIRLYDILYDDTWPLEGYNDDLKKSKNKMDHQNAYLFDAGFKNIMASLANSIKKAANDDF
jgi:hypothetical protein